METTIKLYEKMLFCYQGIIDEYTAKQCTLIAIDEVIKALEEHQWQNRHTIEDYKQMKLDVEKL